MYLVDAELSKAKVGDAQERVGRLRFEQDVLRLQICADTMLVKPLVQRNCFRFRIHMLKWHFKSNYTKSRLTSNSRHRFLLDCEAEIGVVE